MARFQYSMQSILNVKYKLEGQAKSAFRAAAVKLMEEEERLATIKKRQENYEKEARRLVSSQLDVTEINRCRQAIELMKEAARNQLVVVHIAQRNLEGARARLNEVMKECKTHEKLKDREFEEFKHEIDQEESKAIDELVSYSYQGKANG